MPARPLRRIAHLAHPCLRPRRACAREHISHAKTPAAPSRLTDVTSFHSVVGNERRGDPHERRYGLAHPTADPNSHRARRCAHRDSGAGYWIDLVLLPSLGRGASDFDPIAEWLAGAGYRVLRPQPRGIGQSVGPLTGIDLHDYAADVAAVIAHENRGPAFVVGHAFGNRVARMLATDRPDLVRAVALVAANIGKAPSPPEVRAAIRRSADTALLDEERLAALQLAFFAPGNDPRGWLAGWHPEVLAAQRIAGDRTSRDEDFAAGRAPILYVQPDHDPLAHAEDAEAYKAQFGDRVTIVTIARASHAVIVEQPEAVSAALIAYARQLWAAEYDDLSTSAPDRRFKSERNGFAPPWHGGIAATGSALFLGRMVMVQSTQFVGYGLTIRDNGTNNVAISGPRKRRLSLAEILSQQGRG